MAAPMLLAAYRGAWRAAWPLVAVLVKRRDRIRGVPPSVAAERFGWSKRPGRLAAHGAICWSCPQLTLSAAQPSGRRAA